MRIVYTNYRHQTAVRTSSRSVCVRSTEWHPNLSGYSEAFDVEKGERRSFAMATSGAGSASSCDGEKA